MFEPFDYKDLSFSLSIFLGVGLSNVNDNDQMSPKYLYYGRAG